MKIGKLPRGSIIKNNKTVAEIISVIITSVFSLFPQISRQSALCGGIISVAAEKFFLIK
jgi:Mg2+/Co2+ transporter CorC